MRGLYRVLIESVVLAAALNAPALAQSTYTTDAGVNQTADTSCPSGEAVALSGNLHFVYSFTTDAATGTSRYQIDISSTLSGVGQATQVNYVGENASFGFGLLSTSSPAQFTVQLGSRLSPQNAAPSLMLSQTVNITVDTSGNISASVPSSSTTCAGS